MTFLDFFVILFAKKNLRETGSMVCYNDIYEKTAKLDS